MFSLARSLFSCGLTRPMAPPSFRAEKSLVTGVNDWERLILKHHQYYRSRRRRNLGYALVGLFIGVIVERNLWNARARRRV
jgi:hypothetical protein